jgi:DNA-binding CsgD family transcriptional regulator/tetratricopeptide (TPR) repeat protein
MEDIYVDVERRTPDFFGRVEELNRFSAILAADKNRELSGLVVSGEPGIGKSRLLSEYCRMARHAGCTVLPHRFIVGAERGSRSIWHRFAGQLSAGFEDTATAHAGFDLFLQAAKTRSPRKRTIILLDNLHLAPETFHDELAEALWELTDHPIVLTAAYQDVPAFRTASFLRFLTDIKRIPKMEELRLEPLSEKTSTAMLEYICGEVLEETDAKSTIIERCSGNPLFLREIARLMRTRLLEHAPIDESFWTMEVPKSIHTVIAGRLQHISEPCGLFLRSAALVDEKFALEEIETLCPGCGVECRVVCVDEAAALGFIHPAEHPEVFCFSHTLIRDAILYTMPLTEKKRLCRELALQAETRGMNQTEPWLSRLVRWWKEAESSGDQHKSKRYAVKAAEHSLARSDYSYALELIEKVIDTDMQQPGSRVDAELLFTCGQVKNFLSQPGEAIKYFKRALRYLLKEGDSDKLRILYQHPVHFPIGDPDISVLYEEIMGENSRAPGERGMLLVHYAGTLINNRGDYAAAETVLIEAQALAMSTGDQLLKTQWLIVSSYLDYLSGRFERALQRIDSAAALVRTGIECAALPHIYFGKCAGYIATGKFEAARSLVAPMLRLTEALPDSPHLFMSYAVAARLSMLTGAWPEALQYIQSGLKKYPDNVLLIFHRIWIEYIRGNIDSGDLSRRYLSTLLRRVPDGPFMTSIYASAAEVIRSLVTGEAAALPRAVARMRTVIHHPKQHPFIRIRALTLLCIASWKLKDPELAAESYRQLQQMNRMHLIRPYFISRALALAVHCTGDHAKSELLMRKALDSARQYRDDPMEARLWYELSEIRMRDEPESAEPSAEMREELNTALLQARAMGMAPLQRRVTELLRHLSSRGADEPFHIHLSTREQEVLRLAGTGLSNQAIAERLHISLNTVSNHLKSVYRKTGTQNRTAAVAVAKQHELLE